MYFFQMRGKTDTHMDRYQMLCWVRADSIGSNVCGELLFSFLFMHCCHAPLSARCPGYSSKVYFHGVYALLEETHRNCVICHTVMSIGERIKPGDMQGG